MSIYEDDWGDPVDTPRRMTLAEQEQTGLSRRTNRNTYVPAAPARQLLPVQTPANDALGTLVAGLMAAAQTTHTADPVSRGKALLIKASAITVFLAVMTIAALAMLDALAFFLWLLLASGEWVLCFLYLAYSDWREHPNSIRWTWTQGLLGMMRDEQRARLNAQYGKDSDQ